METIDLGTSGRKTTRLGYGCTALMDGIGRRESLAMLEAAFDAGVRHFDVAPDYGAGEAESCLGDFLHRHRGYVTVTTKYGVAPSSRSKGLMGFARSLFRPFRKATSASHTHARIAAGRRKAGLSAAHAKESLNRSLRALRTERIDVWLLQDVTADDLRDEAKDEAMLRLLEDSVASGAIGSFGVGSERTKVETIAIKRPKFCPTMQFEWSALDRPVTALKGFRIHHRALTSKFLELHTRLSEDKVRCAQWSEKVGADLGDREMLASLMLKTALVQNPESVILFSSKNPVHMRRNSETAEDSGLGAKATRLYDVMQAAAKGGRAIEAGG